MTKDPSPALSAAACAGSNIAFVKYWGVRKEPPDAGQPLNPSISMTLREAVTTTRVTFRPGGPPERDALILNERPGPPEALVRVTRVLDEVRRRAGLRAPAEVVSANNFPTSTGVASSASGFAALALAAAAAAGLPCAPQDLVDLAHTGSGSACRSLYGGYVLWDASSGREAGATSVRQIVAEDYWPLVDLVAVVSRRAKKVPSTEGHLLAWSSPFLEARLSQARTAARIVEKAILDRDFETLCRAMEAETLSMHAVMMTSQPALLYWLPETVAVMGKVRSLREQGGIPCAFTIDAGPNVHVIALPEAAPEVRRELEAVPGVEEVLFCTTGGGPRLLEAGGPYE